MKVLVIVALAFVCGIGTEASCFGKPWKRNSLKAKYVPVFGTGVYDLPQSTNSNLISKDNYVQVSSEEAKLRIPGFLYCLDKDSRVCTIYDKKGTVVGVRTNVLQKDVSHVEGYDVKDVNSFTETNVFNETAYSFDVYFHNPETITEGGVGNKTEVAEGLWAYIHGNLVSLGVKDPKVDNYNGFQRQACFPQMGQHYFYGVNKTQTDCTQHVPFFGIFHNGGLVGFGSAFYGKASKLDGGRDWYETVPHLGAKLIMPNRPQCVDELITKNGLYSLHVYFVETPALIGCLFQ